MLSLAALVPEQVQGPVVIGKPDVDPERWKGGMHSCMRIALGQPFLDFRQQIFELAKH